jgi:hypothetical protein
MRISALWASAQPYAQNRIAGLIQTGAHADQKAIHYYPAKL